jgi:hypothetical protein
VSIACCGPSPTVPLAALPTAQPPSAPTPPAPRPPFAPARCGLGVPLFSRLLGGGLPCLLLEVQYRMHPAIAAFPSARFYAARLRSGVGPRERPLIQARARCVVVGGGGYMVVCLSVCVCVCVGGG